MPVFEDVILTDSIEVRTTPEKVFNYLTGIVDDESYRAWHNADHVSSRWLKGQPWKAGSVMYAEEYLHGKLHRLEFKVTKVVPNRHIEYVPTSRFLRRYFPKNEFIIKQKGDSCLFVASVTFRAGWIVRTFFKKAMENGLSSVRKHMKEEGENLKRILES